MVFSVEFTLFLFFAYTILFLPFKKKNSDDDADNEDHSQHGTHHPQQPLLLVDNWLRIHVRWSHGVRVRACWEHCLQEPVVLCYFFYKYVSMQVVNALFGSGLTFSERSSSASTKKTYSCPPTRGRLRKSPWFRPSPNVNSRGRVLKCAVT